MAPPALPPRPPSLFLPDPGQERAEFLSPPPPLLLPRKELSVLWPFGLAARTPVPGGAGLLCCQASSSFFRNNRTSPSSRRMRSSFSLLLLPRVLLGAMRSLFLALSGTLILAASLWLLLDSPLDDRPRLPHPLPHLPLPPALVRADCIGSDDGRCFVSASQARCCCCGLSCAPS